MNVNNTLENEEFVSGFMRSQGIDSLTLPFAFSDETPDEEHMYDWNGQEVKR